MEEAYKSVRVRLQLKETARYGESSYRPLCLPVSPWVRPSSISVSGVEESGPFKIRLSPGIRAVSIDEGLNDPGQLASFVPGQGC